jgi:hypothetical protein
MPSKEVLARQRALREAEREVPVNISLMPYNVSFRILLSQLALIPYFDVSYCLLLWNVNSRFTPRPLSNR